MGYNTYNPYFQQQQFGQAFPPAYNPPYQQNMMQSQMNTQPVPIPQVTAQQEQSSSGMIWVHENEVNNYLVAPNSAVALWDIDKPFVYKKEADASGKPSVRIYELVERQSNQQTATVVQSDEYALKSDLQSAMSRIAELEKICKEGA